MKRLNFRLLLWLSGCLSLLVGCGGEKRGKVGAFCNNDSECELGLCYEQRCLDPDGDEDEDGLKNGVEIHILHTNPKNKDSDGDGIDDLVEVGDIRAALDSDGDAKTDPTLIDANESLLPKDDPDHDCLPDQFDPHNNEPDVVTEAQLLAACQRPGVCKEAASEIKATCEGGTLSCDYSAVPGYEEYESSCDGKDNDCNGRTDEKCGGGGGQTGSGEFQVNTYTTGEQSSPSVAALPSGGFLVVWQSESQDGSGFGIFAQRYKVDGNKDGEEFQVNETTTGHQSEPSVAALTDGGFVVVWMSDHSDNGYGFFGQRYKADGTKDGGEFRVDTKGLTLPPGVRPVSVAALADGGFVVVWQGEGQDGSLYGIFAQRYDADGIKDGAEFQANTTDANGQQLFPRVAGLAGGGFVVVWDSFGRDGSGAGIAAQRYKANGNKDGEEFQVNTYTIGDQGMPSVAALTDGGFVVAWTSNGQDGDRYGIFAQRYKADGSKDGGEFQVNTYTTGDQMLPVVAGLAGGGFVVVWINLDLDSLRGQVFAQRYKGDGTRDGGEFKVNADMNYLRVTASAAGLTDGGFVVVWDSEGQDGSEFGIFAKRYNADGTPIYP